MSKEYKLDAVEIDSAEWYQIDSLPRMGPVATKIINLYKDRQNS